ncbi:MAG TPA: enolase C-terminal domain-like protein [Bryobacteraceae bacterium]|nr:enolase C-terminal domain-like protein [Bryobacteraceae bacterium]
MSFNGLPVVTGLTVRAVRVPMPVPHRTASGVITESPLVLVDIPTSDGVVGHSMVFTYTVAALGPTAALIQNLGPLIQGRPLAPAQIERELAARFRLLGTQGLVGMALAGIDMALWDALARTHQTSLVQLLGSVEQPVRAYGAVGYDGPLESARVAENWALQGFTGVKAKIGYPNVKQDLEVIRAIRHAIGDDVAVMVDYNQSLTPTEAMQRLRLLDNEGLTWVEEPTLAHDYAGHAAIAREIRTPIQCGENWWGALDLCHAIEARASDYVMPEVMKMGGVTGWLRAVSIAETHSLQVSTHLWSETSAQLLCTTRMAHWLEYSDWWNPILSEPLRIDRGMASIEGVRGTGVEWNEEAVSRYLV